MKRRTQLTLGLGLLALAPLALAQGGDIALLNVVTLLYNLPDHYLHLANFVLQQLDALKGHYGG